MKSSDKIPTFNPVVTLTADALRGDMKSCIESGCNDYLSKPIDKTQLLNLVKRLLTDRC